MSTFRVTTEDLAAFAAELHRVSGNLDAVSSQSLGAPCSGDGRLDVAVDGFQRHWGSTAKLMADELRKLGDKVEGAAGAYRETDDQVIAAASPGAA